MMQKIALLLFIAILIFVILFCVAKLYIDKKDANKNNKSKQIKGFVNKLNHNEMVNKFASSMPNSNLEQVFNRAKNPWKMTISTFQFVRYGGLLLSLVISIIGLISGFGYEIALFCIAMGILSFWYPMYYYKAIGHERESEWNKTYEFIWVIKHNLMIYDPAKAFMNTKIYIQTHTPHNKELIQGFDDFYKYWSTDEIHPYISRFYPFSVSREIYQIVFNMSKTGDFPEDSLNSLRSFIINSQNLTVEKTLSAVSGKATIYSLPFLMFSVIIALMVPLVFQIIQFI